MQLTSISLRCIFPSEYFEASVGEGIDNLEDFESTDKDVVHLKYTC